MVTWGQEDRVGGWEYGGGGEVIPKVFLVEMVCFKTDCGDDFTYL